MIATATGPRATTVLELVDAHCHHYADDLPGAAGMSPYDWQSLSADVVAAGAVLRGCVHVEAGRGPQLSIAETRRWQQAHGRSVARRVLVASVQLEHPALAAALDEQQRFATVVGVRQMLDWWRGIKTPNPLLLDRSWRRGLASLAARRLSFDLQVLPEQLPEAAELVRANPEVQFVLDHGGLHIPWQQADLRMWADDLRTLGRLDNVAVKTSGFDTVDPTWDRRRVHDYLAVLVQSFGPRRTLFASNFPIDRATVGYRELLDHHLDALAGFSTAERGDMFARNASRIYRIKE